ncbi:MAG TPA: hypothetical protein VLX68_12305 [Chitinivibrionales bacterium]|nr:hypothetical protein [Chitinivibrionales bacterium]
MKSPVTFFIGLFVLVLCAVQFALSLDPVRIIGVAVGAFFLIFGWFIGWTRSRTFTLVLGHAAVAIGCLVVAYAIYQLPSVRTAPNLLNVLDLPLFWGLLTMFGGYCMITHGYCNCCIRQNESKDKKMAG